MDQAIFINLPLSFLRVEDCLGILFYERTIGLAEMIGRRGSNDFSPPSYTSPARGPR